MKSVTTIHLKLACALTAAVSICSAQNFYGAGASAETGRRAGVYSPSTHDVSDALSINPAGLTSLDGPTINLGITGLFGRGSFTNASNNNSPMDSNNGFMPMGAFGSPIGKHLYIGFGTGPDLLSASKWNYSDTPGFAGVTYGPQSEKSQIFAIRSAFGAAYRFSDKFSIGATVGADWNANTLYTPYIFQSHPALAGLKTLLNLHTTGYGWNSSFGFMAKPGRNIEIGGSYRTPTAITSHGFGRGNIGIELQAIGLGAAQPDFSYQGQVEVQLPPAATFYLGVPATHATRVAFQADWVGWKNSFDRLPVLLTNGTNNDINGVLQSTSLADTVPLQWKNQITVRGSIERSIREKFVISGGYLHSNNPVPNSTLSPLTAAIMQNGIAAGGGWHLGRFHFDASYGFDFTARQRTGDSALLYNEFDNATTKIGTQAFTLTTSFRL